MHLLLSEQFKKTLEFPASDQDGMKISPVELRRAKVYGTHTSVPSNGAGERAVRNLR